MLFFYGLKKKKTARYDDLAEIIDVYDEDAEDFIDGDEKYRLMNFFVRVYICEP